MEATSNSLEIKKQNRSRIVKYIIENKETSRQRIAKALGYSMPTVFSNVTELIETGLLHEVGEYGSTGGRKAKMLAVCKGFRYVVGIDISKRHVRIVLMDLSGEIVKKDYYPCLYEDSAAYYHDLGEHLEKFLDNEGIERNRMIGVGISIPGVFNLDEGVLQQSHILNVKGVSLQRFEKNIHYPISFGNDAKCAAYAELKHTKENVAYFSLKNTIGGAIYHNGVLYEGDSYKSGEFGHMIVRPGGRPCFCGKRGCLVAYCSGDVLRSAPDMPLEDFFAGVDAKDADCLSRWDDYMDNLAIAVTNIRMALDCNIVLGGYVGYYMERYMDDFAQKTKKYNSFDVDTTYLSTGKFLDLASAIGAAQIMVERYIDEMDLAPYE